MPALAMNETRPIYGRARMYAPHGLGNQLALRRNNIGKLSVLTGGQLRSLDYSFLRDADGLQSDADALLMTPQPKPAPVSPQVEELKQSLGRPVWKQTGSLIDQQITLLFEQMDNLDAQIQAYGQLVADKQEELDKALNSTLDVVSSNVNVLPGSEVPFTVVFINPPAGASDYKVRIAEASIPKGPGNLTE